MDSQNKTKDSLTKLKAYKLQYARVVLAAAIVLYPVSGFILKYLNQSHIENIGHRFLLSAMFGFFLIGSFKIQHIKKNVLCYLYLSCFIAIVWSGTFTAFNNFNSNYSIVLLTGIAATASIILNRNLTVLFLLLCTVVLCIFIPLSSNYQLSPLVLPLSTIILFAVYFIRETYRQQIVREVKSLNKQLLVLNSKLEEKVIERTKMLEKKNEELEKLTYIVSHDLKSPLRNIGSFASLIEKKIEKGDFEAVSSYGKIISKSVNRMSTIISDLLTFGKIDQKEKELDEIHMESLIKEIININFSSDLYSNVRFNIATDFPDIIKYDYNQLSLLLENLIGNGIKYNDSTIKFIRVYYKDAGNSHRVFVQDNGIGISEKYNEKIFEMFSRLHGEGKYDGTGIGLSICKKIVQKHGGDIEVHSKHGEGTTFCFSISKNPILQTPTVVEKQAD